MLGAFKYAREEGTAAYKLKGQVPKKVKDERYVKLMEAQKDIWRARLSGLKGRRSR